MSRFLSARFSGLTPYVPGEQPQNLDSYIKLNTNESPFPPSPKVKAALSAGQIDDFRLYPDPTAGTLLQTMAGTFGVKPSQVYAGNGSDEVLAFAFLAFCDAEQEICYPDITYGFYPVFAGLFGLKVYEVPLDAELNIDYRDYLNCGKHVIFANPNAPTGMGIPCWQIEEILKSNPDYLVIVDEAYVDFGGESAVQLIDRYENLLVIGTFSKSRSLAGARIGYAVGQEALIADLNQMKFSFNPYNLNRLSLLAGTAALEDTVYFKDCTKQIIAAREYTKSGLETLGFSVLPSQANFVFAKHAALQGQVYYGKLKEAGILVRHFEKDRIRDYVRISIGMQEQMETFLAATRKILEEVQA